MKIVLVNIFLIFLSFSLSTYSQIYPDRNNDYTIKLKPENHQYIPIYVKEVTDKRKFKLNEVGARSNAFNQFEIIKFEESPTLAIQEFFDRMLSKKEGYLPISIDILDMKFNWTDQDEGAKESIIIRVAIYLHFKGETFPMGDYKFKMNYLFENGAGSAGYIGFDRHSTPSTLISDGLKYCFTSFVFTLYDKFVEANKTFNRKELKKLNWNIIRDSVKHKISYKYIKENKISNVVTSRFTPGFFKTYQEIFETKRINNFTQFISQVTEFEGQKNVLLFNLESAYERYELWDYKYCSDGNSLFFNASSIVGFPVFISTTINPSDRFQVFNGVIPPFVKNIRSFEDQENFLISQATTDFSDEFFKKRVLIIDFVTGKLYATSPTDLEKLKDLHPKENHEYLTALFENEGKQLTIEQTIPIISLLNSSWVKSTESNN